MPQPTTPTAAPDQAVRLHNAEVNHAGRVVGTYPSGNPRYATRCRAEFRVHRLVDPSPVTGEVTCKRCLAKQAALAAAKASR